VDKTAAVTVYQERISPLFEAAEKVLLLSYKGGELQKRSLADFPGKSGPEKVQSLSGLGVTILLCGAISRTDRMLAESRGIAVYPFLSGTVEEILETFCRERPPGLLRFSMPGRREANGHCNRFRHRYRG